jgi:signal transduction histidine kinase
LDLDYPSYEIIDDEFGKLRDEIAKIVLENKKITKDAEKNSQILTDYTEDIAHQIKTPLTGILLMLDLLEEDKENQDLYIKKIRENLSRLKELSDLLLKLASLDSGQINMKKDQVDIKKLLEDLIDEMEIYFSSDDFALSISGEDFILTCDKRRTYEAAFNLVKNALEASEKKKVDILLKETNIYKSILVIDYSQGMDKKMLEKVFKRFYKANPKSKGYGIGLPMAKSIMEKQNGDLIYVKGKKSNSFEMRFYK